MRCELRYNKQEWVDSSYVYKRRSQQMSALLPMPKVELTYRRLRGYLEWGVNNQHFLDNPVAERP